MFFFKAARQAHRMLALGLGVFILTHFCVHLTALGGPEMYNSALKSVQWIYRNPVIEPILILALITQAITGVRMVVRKWRMPSKSFWAWTQIATGLTLTWVMLQHASAALISRHIFNLDTNFYWVAGPLQNLTFKPFFIPYYFWLVFAVFAHIAAYMYFRSKRNYALAFTIVSVGAVISCTIVAIFLGAFYAIEIPEDYKTVYEALAHGKLPSPATTH
jgi:hypothetical protein